MLKEITPRMQKAIDYANEWRSFFLTGEAWSGKSTLVRHIIEQSDKENIIQVAPTWIAAVNIWWFTIHSTFGISANQEPWVGKYLDRQKREILSGLDMIIVDEVSMVRIDLMESIDLTMRESTWLDKFMWWVPTIFVWDLLQLPPVKDRFFDKVQEFKSQNWMKPYTSEYMFDYDWWRDAHVPVVMLDKVFRQRDMEFVECLNKIRNGKFTQETLDYLNEHCAYKDYDSKMITLTTTNKLADMYNNRMINKLKNEWATIYRFQARISKNWLRPSYSEKEYPVPYFMRIPVWARVLITVNDNKEWKYVNWTMWWFRWMEWKFMVIEKDPQRWETEWQTIYLEKHTWIKQVPRLNDNKRIELLTIGEYEQYPIKHWWAITQHKSQWCTFDHVYVDLWPRSFATWQMYVALSRCTSVEGMALSKPITERYILTHDYVLDYLHRSVNEEDD